jgi:hypothetical protein
MKQGVHKIVQLSFIAALQFFEMEHISSIPKLPILHSTSYSLLAFCEVSPLKFVIIARYLSSFNLFSTIQFRPYAFLLVPPCSSWD